MFLKKFLFSLSFSIITAATTAQIADTFDDADLSSNPQWLGDLNNFTVENSLLRSNGPTDKSMIYLTTAIGLHQEQEWQLYLRLDFAPSGSNRFRFFLAADSINPESASDALFLEIGQTGSDVYRLKARADGVEQEILHSKKSYSGNVEDNIRIYKDADNKWTLYFKDGNNEYIADSSAVSPVSFQAPSLYAGFVCNYTSTRSNLFFMDSFYAGPVLQDEEPPVLEKFILNDAHSIDLIFSESLGDGIGIENFILNETRRPQNVFVAGNKISLIFEQGFMEEGNTLFITSIPDRSNNYLQEAWVTFDHYKISVPVPGDILINEIMADPSPSVELPEVEYVELWNRTSHHFDLSHFQLNGRKISDATRLLKRNSFIILCRESEKFELEGFGDVAGMPSWDILSNTGDNVVLSYNNDVTIDSIAYSNKWYGSSTRSNGGFSLERIKADYPCEQRFNWSASDDMLGGTPGRINSNVNIEPDIVGPKIISAIAKDSLTIELLFNEPLNLSSLQHNDFSFQDKEILDFSVHSYETVRLITGQKLEVNRPYGLLISNISDCSGNLMEEARIIVVLPDKIDKGDLLINEILFDPYPSGVDFVEINNISTKYLNISQLHLSNDSLAVYPITSHPVIIGPGQLLALTIDTNRLKNDYPRSGNLFTCKSLPPLPNDGGDVYLMAGDNVLDHVLFSPDYHLPFLNNVEGVSLERISTISSSNDRNNWTSASSTSGYATPGLNNSQVLNEFPTEKAITLSSPYLSPDQNGDRDFVFINYHFTDPMVGSFSIYDPFGRKIKSLSNNATLSISGQFLWDGTDDNGHLLKTGHYIIIAEIFSVSGQSYIFKEKVVVLR